jgi:hypothetical protein
MPHTFLPGIIISQCKINPKIFETLGKIFQTGIISPGTFVCGIIISKCSENFEFLS